LSVNRGFFVEIIPSEWRLETKGNMSAKYRSVPTEFGPETRFEVRPRPGNPSRLELETRFEQLKDRLLREYLEKLADPGLNSRLRQAASRAAELAWVTCYPLLFFPALFEEKAGAIMVRPEAQEQDTGREELIGA
jgi:hypothetical protein